MSVLSKSFYNQPTLHAAQDLLGCFLVRKIGRRIIRTKIVETEAYIGPNDLASHASRGRTTRNEVMFGKPGIIYVYFTYGLHYMLNIVTEKKDYPAAVLVRAAEPINDLRFKIFDLRTNGPAKLTKFLQIDKKFNGLPIYTKKYGLWIEEGERVNDRNIVKTERIGVDYAGKYKNKLRRFYIKGNKFISKK